MTWRAVSLSPIAETEGIPKPTMPATPALPTKEQSRVTEWVHLCEQWCEPDWTHWCDGSPRDLARLMKRENSATSLPVKPGKCVTPDEALTQIATHCRGSLRGRIMYVIPYLQAGDEAGVLVTDSAAHAENIYRTARIGAEALDLLATGYEFVAQLHLSSDSIGAEQIIRCHLSGPAVMETVCRTRDSQRRLDLTMETTAVVPAKESSCLSCERLCPSRARAVAATKTIID